MHRLPSLLLLFLLIFVAGCNPPPTGGIGGQVPPQGYPTAIISLSPSTTEVVAESGSALILKGRTAACNYPRKAQIAEVISDGIKPDYEKITKINPDLIVYDPQLYDQDDLEQMKQTGAELLPMGGNTLEEFIDDMYKLAKKTGSEQQVSTYVERIREQSRLAQLATPKPTPRVAILMPSEAGEHMIAGVNSFQADIVRASAGEPVGPEAEQFVPLSAETLVELNPDVIFAAGNPEPILTDPRFKSIEAVQKGNVWEVKQDYMLRRGWRVDKLITAVHRFLLEERKK